MSSGLAGRVSINAQIARPSVNSTTMSPVMTCITYICDFIAPLSRRVMVMPAPHNPRIKNILIQCSATAALPYFSDVPFTIDPLLINVWQNVEMLLAMYKTHKSVVVMIAILTQHCHTPAPTPAIASALNSVYPRHKNVAKRAIRRGYEWFKIGT